MEVKVYRAVVSSGRIKVPLTILVINYLRLELTPNWRLLG